MPASFDPALTGARALALYVDGLWSVPLRISGLPTTAERARAVLSLAGACPVLHLPPGEQRLSLARVAHALAHRVYGGTAQPRAQLKPIQRALLETLEDARVEWLAMQTLPGLRRLWHPFHIADAHEGVGFDALLARLARALFDPAHEDQHAWIARVRRVFFSSEGALALATPEAVREAASRLGNDIGQMRLGFDAADWCSQPCYRDDNLHLWVEDDSLPASRTQLEREDGDSHGDEGATSLERPPPAATGGSDQGEGSATALWAELALRTLEYPEWDRLIRRLRSDWCTVIESRPVMVEASGLRSRLMRALRRRRSGHREPATGRPGRGRARDGEVLDVDALIEAGVALRTRREPPARIYRATRPEERRRDILLLLDASASTAVACHDARPLLDHLREAALLLAYDLDLRGHLVRLWAFASDSRHRVRVQCLKNPSERALEARVCARAAGVRSHGSTRIGAVLRHALAHPLAERPLVLLLTDGEVHDIDVHDPHYLHEDLQQVLREARCRGTAVRFLDPDAVVKDGRAGVVRAPTRFASRIV